MDDFFLLYTPVWLSKPLIRVIVPCDKMDLLIQRMPLRGAHVNIPQKFEISVVLMPKQRNQRPQDSTLVETDPKSVLFKREINSKQH